MDHVLGWIKKISGLVPPFCVELVLQDGNRYFLHHFSSDDEETETLVLGVWDMRALEGRDLEELKRILNQLHQRSELADAEKIHSKLDWANLRIHYDDIAYCIEWHDRLWPETERPKPGFK